MFGRHTHLLNDEGLRALTTSFPFLKELDLNSAEKVTNWSPLLSLSSLKTLDVSYSSIGDEGFEAVALLSNLTTLKAHSVKFVTDAGLARFGSLTSLNTLDLGDVNVNEGLESLAGLPNLKALTLGDSATDSGLSFLTSLPALETFKVSGDGVTDEGLVHLGSLANLTELDLSFSGITGAGLSLLAFLPLLRVLDISDCEVGDEGVQHLLRFPSLAGLKTGDISGERGKRISGAGRERLKAGLPGLVFGKLPLDCVDDGDY